MATQQELEQALRAAHEAGNVEHARRLANELSNMDKYKQASLERSVWSGVKALPQGLFQLGANVGDWAYENLDPRLAGLPVPGGGRGLGPGIELTDYSKQRLTDQGQPVPPQYQREGFGDVVNQEMARQHQVKEALRQKAGRSGWDVPETAAMLASPGGVAKVGKVPVVEEMLRKSTQNWPQLAGKMAQGGKAGALYGTAMPVVEGDYGQQKTAQIGVGAGIGAGLPAVAAPAIGIGNWLKEATKPFFGKWAHNLDVNKFVKDNFQGATKAEKKHLHLALQQALPDETVGQAVARYNRTLRKQGIPDEVGGSIVATEKALGKTHEGAASGLKMKPNLQEIERQQTVDAIARTKWERKLAEAIRSKAGAADYKKATEQIIKGDPELARIASNPYFKDQINSVLKLMKAENVDPGNLTQMLHYFKLGIDKSIRAHNKGETSLSSAELKSLQNLKTDLVSWLGKKNPAYEQARTNYAANSVPINRMAVGQELQNALRNPAGQEAATTFQGAMRNAPRTIKRATGESIYDDLGQILTPEQKAGVDLVSESLKNQKIYNQMATSSTNMLPGLTTEARPQLIHILSRPVVIANAVLNMVGKELGPEYRKLLAGKMSNPEALRKIIEKPDSIAAQRVTEILNYLAATQGARTAGEQ